MWPSFHQRDERRNAGLPWRRLACAAALLAAASSAAGGAASDAVRFGTAVRPSGADALCVTLPGPRLKPAQRLFAVFFEPAVSAEIVVEAERSAPCRHDAELPGLSYSARFAGSTPDHIVGLGVVVTGGPYRVLAYGPEPSARIAAPGGAVLQVRACTSREGLHLTAWRGQRRLWHLYYYLGYDTEPSCTEEEVRPAPVRPAPRTLD